MKDRTLGFLEKDYELKIHYLVAQFDRVWKRFQFFLTIQSGLLIVYFGLKFESQFFASVYIPYIAIFLSVIWFVLGSQDKYIIELYRYHVREAGVLLWRNVKANDEINVQEIIVGDSNYGDVEERWYQWKIRSISATKLLALFPVIVMFVWIVIIIMKKAL